MSGSMGQPGQTAQSASILRWGIPREPTWTDGAEQTSPGANTALVTFTVSAGKTGRAFGISLTASEANYFQLGVMTGGGFTDVKDFALAAEGTVFIVVPSPIVSAVPAGSSIVLRNVNAGGVGALYQASLFTDQA